MSITIEALMAEVDDLNPLYVAAPKVRLSAGELYLLYRQSGPTRKSLERLNDHDTVTVDDFSLDFGRMKHVVASGVHWVDRLPIYAKRKPVYGLTGIDAEEGLQNIREFVTNPQLPEGRIRGTVPLEDLVAELIDADASALGVEQDVLERSAGSVLSLVVHLPPVIAAPIIDQYGRVDVDGHELSLTATFVTQGPVFPNQVPLYAGDFLPGTQPLPVDMGLKSVEHSVRVARQ